MRRKTEIITTQNNVNSSKNVKPLFAHAKLNDASWNFLRSQRFREQSHFSEHQQSKQAE